MTNKASDDTGGDQDRPEIPESSARNKFVRGGLQVLSGAIPLVGGILAAAAGAWSEREQEHINRIFKQ